MPKLMTQKTNIEKASDSQNNCAFHAFALGLCTPEMIDVLDNAAIEDADFIEPVAKALKVNANKAAVKTALLKLKQTDRDRIKLQKTLAPILRKLSVELAKKDPELKARTSELLVSAFDDYVNQDDHVNSTGGPKDDIFTRHSFIRDQFEAENQSTSELAAWWKTEGFETFLTTMSQAGNQAGDIELSQLARAFKINLDVYAPYLHRIHHAHGRLLGLSETQKKELIDRGVIDKELCILVLSETELKDRLSKISEAESFIIENLSDLKNKTVPEWSEACLAQLTKRNIIDKKRFIVSAEVALNRIEAIAEPGCTQIIKAWNTHYRDAKTMTLKHQNAHWDNIVTVGSEQPVALPETKNDLFNETLSLFNKLQDKDKQAEWEKHLNAHDPLSAESAVQLLADRKLAIEMQIKEFRKLKNK